MKRKYSCVVVFHHGPTYISGFHLKSENHGPPSIPEAALF